MVVHSKEEELIREQGAVCATCGGPIELGGHENRLMCIGCNMPTGNCSCNG